MTLLRRVIESSKSVYELYNFQDSESIAHMTQDKIRLKLVLNVGLIVLLIAVALLFIVVGVNIYGARFYVFVCITTFLTFIAVHTMLMSMFSAIDAKDGHIDNSGSGFGVA
jgi:uncharacterized Tic20 family protein